MPNEIGTTQPETTGRSRGPLGWILILAIPVLIIIGFIIATRVVVEANKKPKERTRSFNTLAVLADYARTDDVQLKVSAQGEVRPQIEIDLVPQVGGQIINVSRNFIQGGTFKKGEVLLQIEPADFEIAVIQAESDVALAEQNLIPACKRRVFNWSEPKCAHLSMAVYVRSHLTSGSLSPPVRGSAKSSQRM